MNIHIQLISWFLVYVYDQSAGTCGYLWDTSQHVRLKHSYRLKPSSNQTISTPSAGRVPFLGRFAVLHAEIAILNVPFPGDDQIHNDDDVR